MENEVSRKSGDSLMNLIDSIASDFLVLGIDDIDAQVAGEFLNKLGELMKEAQSLEIVQLKRVAGGLSDLLKKISVEGVKDKEAGFSVLEKGIMLMQDIDDSFRNRGGYNGDIEGFMESVAALTGDHLRKGIIGAGVGVSREGAQMVDSVEGQDESLLRDFVVEGLEYIGEIEVNILNLEQDHENIDYINAIFRSFHSIKGVASFLNLEQIRSLSHDLETLLNKVRDGELPVTPPLIDIILEGADVLKIMLIKLKSDLEGKASEPLKIDLPALRMMIKNAGQEAADKSAIPTKHVTPSLSYQGGGYKEESRKLGEILLEDGIITKDGLHEGLDAAKHSIPPMKVGEALIAEGKVTPKQVSQALRRQAKQAEDATTIRVNIRKLDDLIDLVGELVIAQSMIRKNAIIQSNGDRKLIKDIARLSSITSELQRTSTSLRMVPVKQSFQRMTRLVRDLSRNAGKLVGVFMEGEDTEIDRNMVDEIYNPLVHMARNAIDHGIEFPEERVKLGKPEKGIIRLRAYHKRGNVVIEISDDGRGLDKDMILAKAVENGVIGSSHSLSDHDILRLIFHPGLSTAGKVTDVSGRGVGMDVVKQAVERLHGKIEIDSTYGEGTTFTMIFPPTMAIINGMVVRVGAEKYIIPTTAIRLLLRPPREACNNVVGKGEMINVMGKLMPLVRLHELFGIASEYEDPWEAIAVVVEGENRSKCLLVDEIIGEEEVVIKNLGERLKNVKGISGGAILGDGNVGLILDTEGIFELSEGMT